MNSPLLQRPWLHRLLVSVGLALLAAIVVATARFNLGSVTQVAPKLPSSMLFQLRDSNGVAVFNAVIASNTSDWLVLPADLDLGDGRTLADSANALDPASSLRDLRQHAGLDLVATWRLDRLGLAAMIDRVGGIYLTPKSDVTLTDTNGTTLVLTKGVRTVIDNGSLAARYATDCRPVDCVDRFHTVWRQVLRELDKEWLRQTLAAIGSSSMSTLGQADLVAAYEQIQRYNTTAKVRFVALSSQTAIVGGRNVQRLTDAARDKLLEAGVAFAP